MLDDTAYMREALRYADVAQQRGDVPVGALVVQDGRVVGTGFNQRERADDPTGHAEIVALREACRAAKRWRLDAATLYVTLEPCPMCAGAIVNARIARLVFGARDAKAGAVSSLYGICTDVRLNHRLAVREGVLGSECSRILSAFFSRVRKRSKQLSWQQRRAAAGRDRSPESGEREGAR
ncbi:MAG: tRNA adenosine(34) deaminase TadA [Nannocystaceae bacterium]